MKARFEKPARSPEPLLRAPLNEASPMILAALLCSPLALPPPMCPPRGIEDWSESTEDRIEWFMGTWTQLLERARTENRVVFVDFQTDWCSWCRVMENRTFTQPEVIAAMRPMLCWSVDGEGDAGRELVSEFGVNVYPSFLFVDPGGTPRDLLRGYLSPTPFKAEVERILRDEGTLTGLARSVEGNGNDLLLRLEYALKLGSLSRSTERARQLELALGMLENEIGFDASDVAVRHRVALLLRDLGRELEARGQIAAIKRLDPEGKSLTSRRIALDEAVDRLDKRLDPSALRAFVAKETDGRLCFEAWRRLAQYEGTMVPRDKDGAEAHRTAQRAALAKAWENVPEGEIARFGGKLAWAFYEQREVLDPEEKAFAVRVAERASASAPHDTDLIDTLACCLWAAGDHAGARAAIERAIELAPHDPRLLTRRAEIEKSEAR